MDKKEIFRDTKNWYINEENYASPNLIKFAAGNAGKNILDIGCATGEYCNKLESLGFKCTGIDINRKYIKKAQENGVEAYVMEANDLKFPDNSFDTVLLFEVLEHVNDPLKVLKESKKVSSKNILVTVPNCTKFNDLRASGLTYEHMLEKDHVNFFTKTDLKDLISEEFNEFEVLEKEPIWLNKLLKTAELPGWLRIPILVFSKINPNKTYLSYRLYAIIDV